MAKKVKTEHVFDLKLRVFVDADEISNYEEVEVSSENVVKAVNSALEAYKVQMADELTDPTGHWWIDDAEVIGSVMNFEVQS
jgi:hypothetical protein